MHLAQAGIESNDKSFSHNMTLCAAQENNPKN